MLVESFAVQNYRSFGSDKNVLQVNPGITTIVGMNESGKSNLIEALCKIDLVNGITEDMSAYRNRINMQSIEISVLLKGAGEDPEEIVGSGQTKIILGENGRYEITGSAVECFASKIASYDLPAAMKTGKYDNANDRNTVIREINALKEYSNVPLEKTLQRIKRARTLVNIYIKDEERKREALDYVESLATHFECLLGGIPSRRAISLLAIFTRPR